MVSEYRLYLHLFNKENIWSNPHASSHPDKNNNSVYRIISKRRGERRSKERFFNLSSSTVVFPHSYKSYSVSTRNPVTPSNSAYRINSSTRNTTTTRLIPCRLLPATVPRVPKHSTRQNKAPGLSHSIPRPYSTSRLPVILPGRNSILGGRQHPRSPYISSQASSTVPHYKNSTRRNKDSFQRVKYCMSMQY